MVVDQLIGTLNGVGIGVLLGLNIFTGKTNFPEENESLTLALGIIFTFIIPGIFITIAGWKAFLMLNGLFFLILIVTVSGIIGYLRAMEQKKE